MNDMISRQAAIDEVQHIYSVIKGTDVLVKNPDAVFQNICNFLASLPSVEPKKGKWIMADEPKKIGRIVLEPLDIRKCSVCGEEPVYDEGEAVLTDFCPNCGADMRGEEEC